MLKLCKTICICELIHFILLKYLRSRTIDCNFKCLSRLNNLTVDAETWCLMLYLGCFQEVPSVPWKQRDLVHITELHGWIDNTNYEISCPLISREPSPYAIIVTWVLMDLVAVLHPQWFMLRTLHDMMSKGLTRFSSGTVYSYWLTAVFLSLPMFDILGYDTITLGGKIGNVLLRLMKNNTLPASFIFKLKKSWAS